MLSLNLMIKPFWILGIDRGVQNMVGYEQYGIYANLFGFALLLVVLLDLGINNFTSSSLAKNPENIESQFASFTAFKIVTSFLYLALTIMFGYFYGFDSYRLFLLGILSVNQILFFFYTFFRSNIGGLQLFRTDAVLSVVDRVLLIIICGIILWSGFFTMTIEQFIYAQTFAYLIAALTAFSVIVPYLKKLYLSFDKNLLFEALKKTYPYAILALLMTIYTRLDVILLQKLLPDGDYQNGVYASAYRLLEAANMMALMVSTLLLPIFSKMISSKDDLNGLVKLAGSIMIVPSIILTLVCYTYKTEIMLMLYPHSTAEAANVFGIVIFCFVPLALMYVFGTLLTANANLKLLNLLAILALITNVVLNLLLIPHEKSMGAAISALVTQSIFGFGTFILAHKKLNLEIENSHYFKMLIAIILIAITTLFIKQFILEWKLGLILIVGCGFLIMVLLKIINPKQALALVADKFSKN